MTDTEKDRMIELLIEVFDNTCQAEGIDFLYNNTKSDELDKLVNSYTGKTQRDRLEIPL